MRRSTKRKSKYAKRRNTHARQKLNKFARCNNRDIRKAINSWWNPRQKKESVAFLKKCNRMIKPSAVGRRGGISWSNYNLMREKIGKSRLMRDRLHYSR